MISQLELLELFEYKDGELYWKKNYFKNLVGKVAGYDNKNGYKKVVIKHKHYFVHRLIFLINHGYMPKLIDHINGNSLDNSIENLREATSSENAVNVKLKKTNTSGFKNVTFNKVSNKWVVYVKVNKKAKYFGQYGDLELADLVATEARNKYHKQFANHGK
jgi:hypothetical protein